MNEKETVTVDHSKPYPEAPKADYNDPTQEHYIGVKDPEILAEIERKRAKRP